MQRSSPSIAALATALAKAQIELANPKKSLTGTIKSGAGEGADRSFRYASLSSGLEIVRKALGQHEIATVQTTAMDQTAGIINLTTVLAHSSGEWIASDWPVCAIAETERPHRMGEALTYARRNALFTLVGIAGEDDLDAPDLIAPLPESEKVDTNGKIAGKGAAQTSWQRRARRDNSEKSNAAYSQPELPATQSANLRAELFYEIEGLGSADDAALWAQRRLAAKNQLSTADARQVEEAFATRLTAIVTPGAAATETTSTIDARTSAEKPSASIIDKSVLVFPEPRRLRDRDHIQHVMTQGCLVCDRRPSDPHHLRFAQSRALARKVSAEFTVPLCRTHHREVHRYGDEEAWWQQIGTDPLPAARTLWLETHPLPRVGDSAASNEAPAVAQPTTTTETTTAVRVPATALARATGQPNGRHLQMSAKLRTSKLRNKANRSSGEP
jgi:hypothetical protein